MKNIFISFLISFTAAFATNKYDGHIKFYSELYGHQWLLIKAQIAQESSFRPNIVSSAGAVGLGQFLPSTFKFLRISGSISDPESNIHAVCKYMRMLCDDGVLKNKTVCESDCYMIALKAYNGGLKQQRRVFEVLGETSGKERHSFSEHQNAHFEIISRWKYRPSAVKENREYPLRVMSRYLSYQIGGK